MKLMGVILFLLALMIQGSFSTTFTFTNKCPYTVWPGILTNPNSDQFPSTGFELANGASQSLDALTKWQGRFWARTGCTNDGGFTCMTGNCGSQVPCNGAGGATPATLVEFTIQGSSDNDFYDISLVDGFNLPMSATPQEGSSCSPTTCATNINSLCPPELAVKGSDGSTVGCKSACLAFNQPQYCCTESFQTPDTCQPTNYSKLFKDACPQAYSYAFDDKTSTFTCPTGVNYIITFCP